MYMFKRVCVQVEYAVLWWTAVFPAFPRWILQLREAGLTLESAEGKKLMNSVTVPRSKSQKSQKTQTTNMVELPEEKQSYHAKEGDKKVFNKKTSPDESTTTDTEKKHAVHNNKNNSKYGRKSDSSGSGNSNANNLIFCHDKDLYGEVPHFKGQAQNAALELAPMVAIEVYACVTCLYTTASSTVSHR